jgi:hypothetical protein
MWLLAEEMQVAERRFKGARFRDGTKEEDEAASRLPD